MKITKVVNPALPEPPNAMFSNCLVAGDQIFLSGMTASGTDGKAIGGADFEAQARAAFHKVKLALEGAGANMHDIVKMVVYVTDMSGRPALGKVRSEFFPGSKPCSTLIGVTALASPELMIEVDAHAIRGGGPY